MAIDRYQFSREIKDKEKNFRKLSSTIYPKIEIDDNDIYIYSKIGDTLWGLADKYYGDTTLWWVIAQANHLGKNSQVIEPGIQIRIPQNFDKIISELRILNEVR